MMRSLFGLRKLARQLTMCTGVRAVALLVILLTAILATSGATFGLLYLQYQQYGEPTITASDAHMATLGVSYFDVESLHEHLLHFLRQQNISAVSLGVTASSMSPQTLGEALQRQTTFEATTHIRRVSDGHPKHTSSTKVDMESILSAYYGINSGAGELQERNVMLERALYDEGYAINVTHSDSYWDAAHVTRRGYGLEGSIFVSLPFQLSSDMLDASFADAMGDTKFVGGLHPTRIRTVTHSACVQTMQSIFVSARWPAAISVGTVEYALLRGRDAANHRSRTHDRAAHQQDTLTLADTSTEADEQIIVSCMPSSFASLEAQERYGFSFADSVRMRHIALPLQLTHISTFSEGHNQPSSRHALRYMTLQLYRGESYTMFLHPNFQLVPAWDWKLKVLHTYLPDQHRAILTTRPAVVGRNVWALYAEELTRSSENLARTKLALYSASHTARESPTRAAGDQAREILCMLHLHTPLWLYQKLCGASGRLKERSDNDTAHTLSVEALQLCRLQTFNFSFECGLDGIEINSRSLTAQEVLAVLLSVDNGHHQNAAAEYSGDAWKGRGLYKAQVGSECNEWYEKTTLLKKKHQFERCWLLSFAPKLHTAMLAALEAEREIPVLRAEVKQERVAADQDALLDATVKIQSQQTARLSDCLHDARYLQPLCHTFTVDAPNFSSTTCAKSCFPTPPPALPQKVASNMFVFAPSEAFVTFPFDVRLRWSVRSDTRPPPAALSADEKLRFLTDHEDDVFLSAALWTAGWDFFAPTEPICYSTRSQRAESETYTVTFSPTFQQIRNESRERLGALFNSLRSQTADGPKRIQQRTLSELRRNLGQYEQLLANKGNVSEST